MRAVMQAIHPADASGLHPWEPTKQPQQTPYRCQQLPRPQRSRWPPMLSRQLDYVARVEQRMITSVCSHPTPRFRHVVTGRWCEVCAVLDVESTTVPSFTAAAGPAPSMPASTLAAALTLHFCRGGRRDFPPEGPDGRCRDRHSLLPTPRERLPCRRRQQRCAVTRHLNRRHGFPSVLSCPPGRQSGQTVARCRCQYLVVQEPGERRPGSEGQHHRRLEAAIHPSQTCLRDQYRHHAYRWHQSRLQAMPAH